MQCVFFGLHLKYFRGADTKQSINIVCRGACLLFNFCVRMAWKAILGLQWLMYH